MSVGWSSRSGSAGEVDTVVAGDNTTAVLELEAFAARSWPAADTQWESGWLLRAAGGFTRRANSAVPLALESLETAGFNATDQGPPAVIDTIDRWYAQRGLPTVVALPLPVFASLRTRLLSDGWQTGGHTLMMTAATADAMEAACGHDTGLPPPRVTDTLDDDWLGLYGRDAALVAPGRSVVAGGGARFATLHLDRRPVGIARWTVDGTWVGLTAVTVAASHRRRGLATQLVATAMRDALGRGASRAWLQVECDNHAALALYRGLGFEMHHEYWYHTRPNDGESRE